MNDFFIYFTTKNTKSTKQVKEQHVVINDIFFVSFVLFVVEKAFVVHLGFWLRLRCSGLFVVENSFVVHLPLLVRQRRAEFFVVEKDFVGFSAPWRLCARLDQDLIAAIK